MRVLITGAAGFYGHHFVRFVLENTDWDVVGLDRIDEAGNMNRLKEIGALEDKRFEFVFHDLRAEINDLLIKQIGDIDAIFHIAAASHVDRSIIDPVGYVLDNVLGTTQLLEYARKLPNLQKFFYFSTDEVYGPIEPDEDGEYKKYSEWDRHKPGNPYSGSKSGGGAMCLAYENTYNVPVVITHCMNIFGERQHPEKFIPKLVRYIEEGRKIPIYSDKSAKVSGGRHYIYADHVSEALIFLMGHGRVGERYNIEGPNEVTNLQMADWVASEMDKKLKYKMVASDDVRPGNDFAYGIDGTKLKDMGFEHHDNFGVRLKKVIRWYLENPHWYRL